MVAVIERDRRLARRLAAALEARGCRTRVVHGFGRAVALLRGEVPAALYVAPIDVEATANRLAGMASGEEGTLRALISQSRRLKAHNRANREGADRAVATYQKLRERISKPSQP